MPGWWDDFTRMLNQRIDQRIQEMQPKEADDRALRAYLDEVERKLHAEMAGMMVAGFTLPSTKWFSLKLKEKNVEKTATQKLDAALDEVKSTVSNLKDQVERLQNEKNYLRDRLAEARSPMQRDERALYVNKDGTMKCAPVHAGVRPEMQFTVGPMREVFFEELPWYEFERLAGRDSYPGTRGKSMRRNYRLAFSQGSLHVYQEV